MRPGAGAVAGFVAGLAAGLAPAASAAPAAPPAARAAPAAAKPGARLRFAGRVRLPNGRRIYLRCQGTGRPTVILEAGLRNRADVWSEKADPRQAEPPVFQALARRTKVCAYDRPGVTLTADGRNLTSRSDPVRMPRSAADMVSDLRALTRAAGIPGPFVLAGHSTGGLIARLYASTYPADVRGLVLVDAIAEPIETLLTVTQWNAYNAGYFLAPPAGFEGYANLEIIDFARSFAEMRRRPRPPRQIPLVVLTKTEPFGIPGALGRAVERAWRTTSDDLARLEPGTPHVFVAGVGHYIQVFKPAAVTAQVLRVLDAVRAGRRQVR